MGYIATLAKLVGYIVAIGTPVVLVARWMFKEWRSIADRLAGFATKAELVEYKTGLESTVTNAMNANSARVEVAIRRVEDRLSNGLDNLDKSFSVAMEGYAKVNGDVGALKARLEGIEQHGCAARKAC